MKHILCTLLCLLFVPAVFAQKADKNTDKKAKRAAKMEKVKIFLKDHMPDRATELTKLEEAGDKKAHRAFLRDSNEIYSEYEYAIEEGGEGFAKIFLEELKLAPAHYKLVDRFIDADEDGKAKLRKEMEASIAAITKAEIATIEAELKFEDDAQWKKLLQNELADLKSTDDPSKMVDMLLADVKVAEAEEKKHKDVLPKDWHYDLEKAQAAAKESGKSIHVVFSTVWCGPCKAMAKTVYPQAPVIEAMSAYEPLYIDGDEFPQVVKSYKVKGYPTFIVIDADGELQRTAKFGGTNADTFIEWLNK